jgi:hypothetical protein
MRSASPITLLKSSMEAFASSGRGIGKVNHRADRRRSEVRHHSHVDLGDGPFQAIFSDSHRTRPRVTTSEAPYDGD